MPVLPSGLTLALWDNAPVEHDENWFDCPAGNFWYSVASPEMGTPLFGKDEQVWTSLGNAPAPRDREEAKRFVQILEMAEDGTGAWRGEWLADFPRYRKLSEADKVAWDAWICRSEIEAYLDQVIGRCASLAEKARNVTGYAIFRDHP